MRTPLSFGIGVALFALVVAACSSSNHSGPTGAVCTAGNYVFCRCEDRSEGTKLCRADGVSFDDCKCDGTGGAPNENPSPPGDAGPWGQSRSRRLW